MVSQKLKYDRDLGRLIVTTKGDPQGTCYPVERSQLVVWKIKPESKKKWVRTGDDFEPVEILMEDFPEYILDVSFGSLAYAVVDEAGNNVDVSEINRQLQLELDEKLKNIDIPPIYSEEEADYFLSKLEEYFEENEQKKI